MWTRPGGGGGISRVLCNGNVFEKAGCSLSVVYGSMPQDALQSATSRGADRAKGYAPGERVPFFACGLSSVMHPRNPMAPTMHFNYRYFETDGGVWWFGAEQDRGGEQASQGAGATAGQGRLDAGEAKLMRSRDTVSLPLRKELREGPDDLRPPRCGRSEIHDF